MQWLMVLPLEIMSASLTLQFWDTGLPRAGFITIFLVFIVATNVFGVKAFGEVEYLFSTIKVAAVIGFIILGIIINCAGGQNSGYIGRLYWQDPGAFNNGFKGLCNVLVTAAFAFAGTELVGLAAAETHNPTKSIPTAVKQVVWRISLVRTHLLTLSRVLVDCSCSSMYFQWSLSAYLSRITTDL
jgi:amino acid transporter